MGGDAETAVVLRLTVHACGIPKEVCVQHLICIPLLIALGKENQQGPVPISKDRML